MVVSGGPGGGDLPESLEGAPYLLALRLAGRRR